MRSTKAILASLTLALWSWSVQAQDERPFRGDRRPGPRRLAPEDAEAAWKLQAAAVAKGLSLSKENATSLGDAYVKARRSFADASAEARREMMERMRERGGPEGRRRGRDADIPDEGPRGGDTANPEQRRGGRDAGHPDERRHGRGRGGPGRGPGGRFGGADFRQKRAELIQAEQEKLRAELEGVLKKDPLEKAIATLGTFNEHWDIMVDAISSFNLGEEKTFGALKPIEAYVVSLPKVGEHRDRRAARESVSDARRELAKAMSEILDEEQMARFRRVMVDGRGGRGGRGGFAERLMRFDANGDGMIQRDEVPKPMRRVVERLDANDDGILDGEEIKAAGDRWGRGGPRRRPERSQEGG